MPGDREKEVLALEENLTRVTRSLDLDALSRIYADSLLMTGVMGETCDKAGVMDEARRGAAQRQSAEAAGKKIEFSYDKEDLRVVAHGDAAIASYRFVVRMKGPGVDIHRRYRTTNVWAMRGGHWEIVAAHTAFILTPQQAAGLESEGSSSGS